MNSDQTNNETSHKSITLTPEQTAPPLGSLTWRPSVLTQSRKCERDQLLGPFPLVTSVPIASIPNPHLCASSVCSVVPLA